MKNKKKFRFNRELRARSMVIRFHLLWVLFYFLLIVVIGVIGFKVYNEHREDQLPAGYIDLKVSKTKYQPGEIVYFDVVNHFPTRIFVTNRCPQEPLDVYKWDGKKWLQIHDSATDRDSMCYKQPRRIAVEPESTLSYNFKDWPNLFKNAGVYRIAMKVDHYKGVPYQDFVVLKPKAVIKKNVPNSVSEPAVQPKPASSETQTPINDDKRRSPEIEVEDETENDD